MEAGLLRGSQCQALGTVNKARSPGSAGDLPEALGQHQAFGSTQQRNSSCVQLKAVIIPPVFWSHVFTVQSCDEVTITGKAASPLGRKMQDAVLWKWPRNSRTLLLACRRSQSSKEEARVKRNTHLLTLFPLGLEQSAAIPRAKANQAQDQGCLPPHLPPQICQLEMLGIEPGTFRKYLLYH